MQHGLFKTDLSACFCLQKFSKEDYRREIQRGIFPVCKNIRCGNKLKPVKKPLSSPFVYVNISSLS